MKKALALALIAVAFPIVVLARHRTHQPPPPVITPPPPITSGLQLGAFNLKTGSIQAFFVGWTDAPVCAPAGQTTFLYWENYGTSLDSIINGSQDTVIKNFAARVCANTIVSLFHEMNGNWDPWDGTYGTNTAAKVIAAYKRVHDLMGSKVRYAWVVNDSDVPDRVGNRPANYYPGDAYVDIIGVDGFNWGGLTFMQAIAPNYAIVATYGKPVWITSFGTGQGSNQAAWIADAIAQAKARGIGALIYFNLADGVNFVMNSSAVAAFHL